MNFYMPAKLYTGKDVLSLHKDELAELGDVCYIVTGSSSAKKSGALDAVISVLDTCGISSHIYDKIAPNPTVDSCMEAGRDANIKGARFIIGIGGGSAMDAAKATAVFASNPTLDESTFYSTKWDVDPLPIVLVGTTAGTGSEVTNVSVLTDSAHRKHSLHDKRMYASLSFGDPSFTMSLPSSVTLSTGIDVLAHCTESYFCKKANDISKAFAVRGIKLLYSPLFEAASGAELSFSQRQQLYDASILGGLAICVTGTAFPHNVGYYLTEKYNVPHGIACATFLPELLNYVSAVDESDSDAFYESLGLEKEDLIDLIEKCLPYSDIEMSEEEIALALPRWENNNSVKNTVGNVTVDDIGQILRNKFLK